MHHNGVSFRRLALVDFLLHHLFGQIPMRALEWTLADIDNPIQRYTALYSAIQRYTALYEAIQVHIVYMTS